MNDGYFDWDEANLGHISEHGITPEEAEEVVIDDPLDTGFEIVDGESRWTYVGETISGKILRVVITIRGERIRVITAFQAPRYWKVFYLEQKRELQ